MVLRQACTQIPHRALVSVTGIHAHQFLHGLMTQWPHKPPKKWPYIPKGGFFTAFLHAQGRVLYDVFVYRIVDSSNDIDEYLLEYDSRSSEAPSLLSMLKRYVLRSKVKVRDVSNEWDVWAAWNAFENKVEEKRWLWSPSGAVEPLWTSETWPWGDEHDRLLIRDRRAYGMGIRRLVRKGEASPDSSDHDITSPDEYLRHRIVHGVPEGIDDIPPMQAFPMESNLDIMGAIDFRKGCYVGQELTVRTYFTGMVRKRIFPVKLQPLIERETLPIFKVGLDIRPVTQTAVEGRPSRQRGTGKLLSSIDNVALALLRLEHVEAVEKGTTVLELEAETEEGEKKQSIRVEPYLPTGWPVRGAENNVDADEQFSPPRADSDNPQS